MKKIITLLTILLAVQGMAQVNINPEPDSVWQQTSSYWVPVDTFLATRVDPIPLAQDSVMKRISIPDEFKIRPRVAVTIPSYIDSFLVDTTLTEIVSIDTTVVIDTVLNDTTLSIDTTWQDLNVAFMQYDTIPEQVVQRRKPKLRRFREQISATEAHEYTLQQVMDIYRSCGVITYRRVNVYNKVEVPLPQNEAIINLLRIRARDYPQVTNDQFWNNQMVDSIFFPEKYVVQDTTITQ